MADEILRELWGDDAGDLPEVEFDKPYGLGTWKNAILMDVLAIADHQYGYRVGLVLNLKGEEGMKYTGRVNLPRSVEENGDHDKYERAVKREERTRNTVHGLLLSAGLLGGTIKNVDTDEQYEKVLSFFRQGIGSNFPCRVKIQQKFNKETLKWENTDFTEIVHIKRGK